MTVVNDYTALLSGFTQHPGHAAGGPIFVTYAFYEAGEVPPTWEYEPYPNDGYFSFSATQRTAFRLAASRMEDVAGVRFVEVDDPADAAIRVMGTDGSAWGGWAAYPGGDGRLVIDNSGNFGPGTYAFETMLHELGHAVGLKHPFDGDPVLVATFDDHDHTLMSYTSNGINDTRYAPFDAQALTYLYGAEAAVPAGWRYTYLEAADRLEVRGTPGADLLFGLARGSELHGLGGDDGFRASAGHDRLYGGAGDDSVDGSLGQDLLYGGADNDLFVLGQGDGTVYGGSGADRIELTLAMTLALGVASPAGWAAFAVETVALLAGGSVTGDRFANTLAGGRARDTLAGGDGDDSLAGDRAADRLDGDTGDDTLAGGDHDDVLDGGTGADRLDGGTGRDLLLSLDGGDILWGGTGADEFRLSRGAASLHVVKDFEDGSDTIGGFAKGLSFGQLTLRDTAIGVMVERGTAAIHLHGLSAAGIDAGDFLF
jgi:hypothetical protein